MKEPRGLRETIAVVMRMESSLFCKAMSEVAKVETKGTRTTSSLLLRTSSHYNSHRTFQNSDKKLTESGVELDEMRRNKICFKCKGKYFKDHPCTSKEMRVMTMVNGIDMVVLDECEAQSEQEMEGHVTQQLMMLSLGSLLGVHSPKTTKCLICLADFEDLHPMIFPAISQVAQQHDPRFEKKKNSKK
ncbi:unnamed protein product [Cochlearia groenlandica]